VIKGRDNPFIGPTIWVLSTRDGKTQRGLVQWSLKMFDNGLWQIKDLLRGHLALCLKMTR